VTVAFWALPTPAALLRTAADDLLDGDQLVLWGQAPPGLRTALGDALVGHGLRLRVVDDDGTTTPAALLAAQLPPGRSAAGPWWIEPEGPGRVAAWTDWLAEHAETARNERPAERLRLVLRIPEPPPVGGLGVARRPAGTLERVDLDVAVRYAAAPRGNGALGRLRLAFAVEAAAPLLPAFGAVDVALACLTAPEDALFRPDASARFLAGLGVACACPDHLLWRSHHAALWPALDDDRLAMALDPRWGWRIPWVAAADGAPPKSVEDAALLEIGHLCAQLGDGARAPSKAARDRLFGMREARNRLGHLEPLDRSLFDSCFTSRR
jgi:hypothetical protein